MLDGDELSTASDMAAIYADQTIPQFWDGERLLAREVSRSLEIGHDHPSWDMYLFYPPGAEWTDTGLPAPEKMIVQAKGVVIGARGTLPAKGDQTPVPAWAAGRADVVGEQRELPALLTAVAVPFAERYAR